MNKSPKSLMKSVTLTLVVSDIILILPVLFCLFLCINSYGDPAPFGVNLALLFGAVLLRFSLGFFLAWFLPRKVFHFADEEIINFLSGEEHKADEINLAENPKIFRKSVRDNILYGDFHATEERLKKALDTVLLSPDIFDAEFLSDSDKQKIALARVLLYKPRNLFIANGLDACDNLTIKRIICNIRRNYPEIILDY